MSAPPMGITAITPNRNDRAIRTYSKVVFDGSRQNMMPTTTMAVSNKLLKVRCPVKI